MSISKCTYLRFVVDCNAIYDKINVNGILDNDNFVWKILQYKMLSAIENAESYLKF